MSGLRAEFARRLLYPLDLARTGDSAQRRWLREFEQSQYRSPETLQQQQWERFSALLRHAATHCPFYTQSFRAAGVEAASIQQTSDLNRIPVLTKQQIQQHREEMIASNWPRQDLILNRTGGSSGTPISFYLTRDRANSRAAATWRHNRWAGYNIADKLACLWGAAQDAPQPNRWQRLKTRLLAPTLFLNTARLTDASLRTFVEALKRFRPKIMLAYAKSAVLFARFVQAERIAPYQFHSIITSAEVLESDERRLLESTFGCPVFNRYGCREVSVIASECTEHQGLHVMAEGLLVEIERNGASAAPGERGRLLVTDLLNYGMPLIRYRIGDVAAWQEGACPCGRGLPRLRALEGRVTDFLIGSDERIVSGAALTIALVAMRPSLGQVQILQEKRGQVLFRVAPGNDLELSAADCEFLLLESRKFLGDPLEFEVERVSSIEAESSGKFLFSKSNAPLPF